MNYEEKKMDLFQVNEIYSLAHCISADLKMGAGIAVQFQNRFQLREKLRELKFSWPCTIRVGRVFSLITKERYFHKPTYSTLESALRDMKVQIQELEIRYLAMPKIGCGLDRLNWTKVRTIIQDLFADLEIEILVCYP